MSFFDSFNFVILNKITFIGPMQRPFSMNSVIYELWHRNEGGQGIQKGKTFYKGDNNQLKLKISALKKSSINVH